MSMCFPLGVHCGMPIEPTESESKQTLDSFIATMNGLAAKAQARENDAFAAAPQLTPRRRLDETMAARKPKLRWLPEDGPAFAEAAE